MLAVALAAGILVFSGLVGRVAGSAGNGKPLAWRGLALGGHWVRTSLSIKTNAMLSDPKQPRRVWAATDDGVWRTSDAGVTWNREGLPGVSLASLSLPGGGTTIF